MAVATKAKPKETPIPGRHSPKLARRLRRIVRDLFAEQYADAMDILDRAAGKKIIGEIEPDWRSMFTPQKLAKWAEDVYPVLSESTDFGAVLAREDIEEELGPHRGTIRIDAFNVEAPGARQAVQRAALDLSLNSNDVTRRQMDMILPRLRSEIIQGLDAGESYGWMADRIRQLFGHADKERSARIAMTETQRAIHQGLMHQYQESGVVEATQWMLSGAPCEKCIAVAAESEQGVALFAEYAKNGNNPTYQSVNAPPLHPRCACSLMPVLIPVEQMPKRAA